jgi:hypothetical protein
MVQHRRPSLVLANQLRVIHCACDCDSFLMHFFSTGNPAAWSVAQVASWLDSMHLGDCKAAFEQNEIDGATLPSVDDATLESLGVSSQARRGQVRQAIAGLFASPQGLNECVVAKHSLYMLMMLSCRSSSARPARRHVFVRRMCWAVVFAKQMDCTSMHSGDVCTFPAAWRADGEDTCVISCAWLTGVVWCGVRVCAPVLCAWLTGVV